MRERFLPQRAAAARPLAAFGNCLAVFRTAVALSNKNVSFAANKQSRQPFPHPAPSAPFGCSDLDPNLSWCNRGWKPRTPSYHEGEGCSSAAAQPSLSIPKAQRE